MERNFKDLKTGSIEDQLKEFAIAVKQMRFTQRRYSNTRKPETFETMQEDEKKVDAIVSRILDPQGKLF